MILIGFKVYGPLLSTTLKNPHIADTNKTTEITFIIIFKLICFFFYFKLNYFCGVLEEKITIKRKGKLCLQAMQFIVLVFYRSYRKFRSDQTFPECKKTDIQTCFKTTDIFSTFILIFLLHLWRTDCVKIRYIIDYGGTFLKKILQLK